MYQWKKEYAFDNLGNLIGQTYYNTETGEARISSKEKIEYNSDNNIAIHYWYMYDETNTETVVKDEVKYNEQGNWIEIIRYEFNHESNEWEYVLIYECIDDESGNILEMKHLVWDNDSNDWINISKYNYEYDENNSKVADSFSTWKNEEWTYMYRDEWKYLNTELGALTIELKYIWNEEQGVWKIAQKNETTKNKFGVVLDSRYNWSTKKERFENYLQYIYDYDSYGHQILNMRNERESNDDLWTGINKTIWEYNQNQQLKRIMTFAWDKNTSAWVNDEKSEFNLENNISLLTSIWVDSLNIWVNDKMSIEYYNQGRSLFYVYYFRWDGTNDNWTKRTLAVNYQSVHQNAATVNTIFKLTITTYPNPCTDIISWKNPGNEKISSIQIFSQTGKLVKSIIEQTSNSIDVSGLSPGIYFISFIIKDQAFTNKILIE